MKRIVKRVALLIVGLALVNGVVRFIGIRWGFTPLPKPPYGVRIEPLSPPLTREDLKPDNAAFFYLKASDLLNNYTQTKESKGQMDALLAGEVSGDTKAVEHTLTDCREALDLVRAASDMSFCQMPLMVTNSTFVGKPREMARLLIADGKLAQRDGNPDRAITNYLATVKLGIDCPKGGALIQSLVGIAVTQMGTQAIRAWILQAATTREAREGIIRRLSRNHNELTPYAETLRNELKYAKKEFSHQMHTAAGLSGRIFYSRRVANRCFDAAFGDLIQESDKPFWLSDAKKVVEKWEPDVSHPHLAALNRPLERILIAMLLPAIENARTKTIRADVDLTATEMVCALETYEIDNGKPPDRLSNLVPKFLPTVPIDPFDGKQFRYRREGKEWMIWSVGSDLKDDNAAWHELKYHESGEKREGGDIFFKSTEPQDDLAYYLTHGNFKGTRGRMLPSNSSAGPS